MSTDAKNQKDPKDVKDAKDAKDPKGPKDAKDPKDVKDAKPEGQKVNEVKHFKKPRAVLMDVSGTLTQSTFIPTLLVPYFQKNYKAYLDQSYEQPKCREVVDKLRLAAEHDASAPKIAPDTGNRSALVESVCQYIDYCLKGQKENKPFVIFRFMVWFDGYDRDIVSTPVYADVAIQIQKWRLTQGIQLFVLSNGWNLATNKFLEKTTQGNLALLIQDYFDTELGPLNIATTFQKVLDKIKLQPQDIVFLTKSPEEARAAKEVGINPILVLTHKKDVEAVQKGDIPHVRTFNEIEFD